MIKRILPFILFAIHTPGFSQENKGNFVANTTVYFNYLQPTTAGGVYLGYFVNDRVSFGITGYQSHSRYNGREDGLWQDYSSETVRTSNLSGVFVRYNRVFPNKLGFFISLNPSYAWGKNVITQTTFYPGGGDYTTKEAERSKGFLIDLKPGIIYFINKRFSAEVALGDIYYTYVSLKRDRYAEQTKRSDFGIDFFTTGLNLGVSFYFGCKQKEEKKTTDN